jgi:hypothetical protein
MSEFLQKLPGTLEFRDAFRQALKNNGVKIDNTKTTDFRGSFYNLIRNMRISGYPSNLVKHTRSVHFSFKTDDEAAVKRAMDEIKVWFSIADKHLEMDHRCTFLNEYRISCICVLN